MEPFESLSLCAEVAIAITGFSGVVLVLGSSGGPSSARVNSALFRLIFTGTLTPLGLVAMAFLLDAAAFEPTDTWRICSGAHAVAVCSLAISGSLSSEQRRSILSVRGGWIVPAASLLSVTLSVANAVSLHQFWPFLFCVSFGIALSLFAFVRLVFSTTADR